MGWAGQGWLVAVGACTCCVLLHPAAQHPLDDMLASCAPPAPAGRTSHHPCVPPPSAATLLSGMCGSCTACTWRARMALPAAALGGRTCRLVAWCRQLGWVRTDAHGRYNPHVLVYLVCQLYPRWRPTMFGQAACRFACLYHIPRCSGN